jgi:hypothetical protein
MEFSKEYDWERALVGKVLEFKPDLVITEKGVSGTVFPSVLISALKTLPRDFSKSTMFLLFGESASQTIIALL